MDERIKAGAKALRIVTAMDRRKAQGTMDDKAVAALQEAEATLSRLSGATLLAVFREWRDGGLQAFDPTGGHVRITDETSKRSGAYATTAMRALLLTGCSPSVDRDHEARSGVGNA